MEVNSDTKSKRDIGTVAGDGREKVNTFRRQTIGLKLAPGVRMEDDDDL